MDKILEICCDTISSINTANLSGAKRIELCSALQTGGISPSIGFVEEALKSVKIPINVLIRPRSGNFLYSAAEFEIMCKDIEILKKTKTNGIVSGVLRADGSIDKERTSILMKISKPLSFTFHRAIDVSRNIERAFEEIIEIGVEHVLSSGGEESIDKGLESLIKLNNKYGDKIRIMPGGGLNMHNAKILAENGIREFHFSASEFEADSFPYNRDPLGLGYISSNKQFGNYSASLSKISNMLEQIKEK